MKMTWLADIYYAIEEFLANRGFDIHAYSNSLHFYLSFMLVIMITVCGVSVGWSAVIVLVLGISKELFDWLIRGTEFSWKDLGIDCLGILVGVLFCGGIGCKL
jgi:hypothetical protein